MDKHMDKFASTLSKAIEKQMENIATGLTRAIADSQKRTIHETSTAEALQLQQSKKQKTFEDSSNRVEVDTSVDSSNRGSKGTDLIDNVEDNSIVGQNNKSINTNNVEDTLSLHGESDIEDRVKQLCKDNEDNDSSSSDGEEFLENIVQELDVGEQKGLPIKEALAEVTNKIWHTALQPEHLKNKLEKFKTPQNCNIQTKKVNEEIWNDIMKSNNRQYDLKIQKAQNGILKAAMGIVKVSDELLSLKKRDDISKETRKNITPILQDLTDIMALNANANMELDGFRREAISKTLPIEMKSISKNVPSDAQHLFGEEIIKKMTDIKAKNKILKPTKRYKNSSSNTYTHKYSNYPDSQKNYYNNYNNNNHSSTSSKNSHRFPKTQGNRWHYGQNQRGKKHNH